MGLQLDGTLNGIQVGSTNYGAIAKSIKYSSKYVALKLLDISALINLKFGKIEILIVMCLIFA